MTQYLLSVHMVEGEEPPPPETIERMYADVDALNDEIQARGRVGVRRRPAPGEHRDRRRGRRTTARCIITDGPFAETKEQLGGFWVIEAADLDAALAWAAQGDRRLRRAGRGAAVPGRCRSSRPVSAAALTARAGLPGGVRPGGRDPGPPLRRHRRRRGGGPGGVRRGGRAVAGDRRAAEPGRLDRHDGPEPRHRPVPPRGLAPRPTGAGARCSPQTSPTKRIGPMSDDQARPDLHVLPPGARARARRSR